MKIEQKTLKNNLDTIFVDLPGSTFASAQIWFRAGSALENKSNEGIAHFLEHMFFKGTKTRPGAMIAHEVESFGGEVNAFTSFDYTCYYINTPATHLDNTINILLDMVANPEFKEEDITPEIGVVFEEYRRSLDNPNQYSFKEIQKNIFTKGYSHPILGREQTIKKFNRKQLIEFRKKFYNLSNAFLVVAGDLGDKKKITKTIESYKLPQGKASTFPSFEIKKDLQAISHKRDINLANINIVIQAPHYDKKEAADEDLAFNCLGFGETSILYKELVLKDAIASSASCSTIFMNSGGAHMIRVSFPYENFKKVATRLTEIIKQVTSSGFDKSDVQKIKNQYIASKVYEQESLESYAFSLGHGYAQAQNIYSDQEFIDRIRATSQDDVNKSIQEIFINKSLHLSLQLPLNVNEEKANKSLLLLQNKLGQIKVKLTKNKKGLAKEICSKFDPQTKLIPLKKGISLIYRHNPMTPTFVFHSYLRGGLTEETNNNNGIHHLLSGVITRGYDKITSEEMKLDLEQKSAYLNGFTGKNAYGMTLHGQSEHIESLLQHFFGCFLRPSFPQIFITHEKKMMDQSFETQLKDPIRQCFKAVNEQMFGEHPYAQSTLGTKKSIKSLNRKKLLEIHTQNIKEKELLFTYCGDLSENEVIDMIRTHLDNIEERVEKKLIHKKYLPLKDQSKFISFDREQTQIFYGIPVGKLNQVDNTILKFLTAHLSGQSSKLFVEVRDRQGLCYTAQPLHFNALEGGYWGIYMASGHDKVEAAIKAIKDLLLEIKVKGLSKKEFIRTKKMIKGQNLLNVQTNEDYAGIYSVPTLQGLSLDYYHQGNEEIEHLDHEFFQKSLKKLLSKKWNLVVVGRD